jgi:acetolactate synthase I/II/III large subunit
MMRLADYLFERLANHGVRDVFLVAGSGAIHLNDAIGREPRLRYVCLHHEQACAMAAEAHARISGVPAVVSVANGPGSINALTGVFGAWTDSIPMVVISGQAKRETCLAAHPEACRDLRQLGNQEVDVVRMAQGITKYARTVLDPATICYHVDRAFYLATHGRPGPVWLDIPVDVQAAPIEDFELARYDEREDRMLLDQNRIRSQTAEILERLQTARRPVLMAGSGIRAGRSEALFRAAICRLGIPVTTAMTANDLMPSGHPLLAGRPGAAGDRQGNLAVQNADLLLVLGCRLHVSQTGIDWKSFAPHAYKIQVDVDEAELGKPTLRPDLAVHSELRLFLETFNDALAISEYQSGGHREWLAWCRRQVEECREELPAQQDGRRLLNPYRFVELLFAALEEGDAVVCGNASAALVASQAARIREDQRLIANVGCASMGYDLPAAIGAAFARPGQRVICLAGDGSVQANLQELETAAHHRLPLKIFVLNNGGYRSTRGAQRSLFPDNFVGVGPDSGVSFPNLARVAEAFGIPSVRIRSAADAPSLIEGALCGEGPFLCEVMLDPAHACEPRLDLYPDSAGKTAPSSAETCPSVEPGELQGDLLTLQVKS